MDLTERSAGDRSFYQGISVSTWQRSLAEAEPWHKRHLRVMRELLEDMIERFYDGGLALPVLRVASTDSDTRPGEYRSAKRTGLFAEIRINPRVVDGTLLASCSERGARRYLGDVLLHELVHAWQGRAGGQAGHGSAFAAECNRIGRLLGLPAVEASDAQQPVGRYPCSSWPRYVRPASYYQQEALAEFVPAPSRRRAGAPLTAADRAWVVFELDRERAAKAERRERMRRAVARVRREPASHHGSRCCPSTRPLSGPTRKFVRGPGRTSGLRSCRVWVGLRTATRHDPQHLGTRPSAPLAAPKPAAGP